jgi:hypothetical protein
MKHFIFCLLIFFSGCVPVAKFIGGIHNPKLEDKASLTKYLHKKNIDADNILVFADTASFRKRFAEVPDIPQVKVYNKLGELVYYQDTAEACSGPAYEFTTAICMMKNLRTSAEKSMADEIKNLLTIDRNPVTITPNRDVDYFVFIYWAKFSGIFNKNHVRVWENNLKKVSGCKVSVYKIDMDWQKAWYKKR